MKIPRDLNGADLARQSGSHMRLSRQAAVGQQHLTIPAHKPMRVGTLRQILKDVASQTGVSLEVVIQSIGG